MARIVLVVCLAWLGITFAHNGGLSMLELDERLAYALLLPGVYLVGMLILRD
jgi:hypothetical protein